MYLTAPNHWIEALKHLQPEKEPLIIFSLNLMQLERVER